MNAFPEVCLGLLAKGRSVRFRARGSSMEPAIHDGELVTVEPRPLQHFAEGDVALYFSGRRLIAHRVVARTARGLLCEGDHPDCHPELVEASAVLGAVTAVGADGRPPAARRVLTRWLARRKAATRAAWDRLHSGLR